MTTSSENNVYNSIFKPDDSDESDDVFIESSFPNGQIAAAQTDFYSNNREQNQHCDKIEVKVNVMAAPADTISRSHSYQRICPIITIDDADGDRLENEFTNPMFDVHYTLPLPTSPQSEESDFSIRTVVEPPDFFIPPSERKVLLRKFSAPPPDDPNTSTDKFVIQKQYKTTPIFPNSFDVRTKINDKYKCNMCHNPFNDPRVLDCLHVFCLECIFGVERSTKQEKHCGSQSQSEADLSGLLRISRSAVRQCKL